MMRAKWCTTNLGYGVDGGCEDACTVCIHTRYATLNYRPPNQGPYPGNAPSALKLLIGCTENPEHHRPNLSSTTPSA